MASQDRYLASQGPRDSPGRKDKPDQKVVSQNCKGKGGQRVSRGRKDKPDQKVSRGPRDSQDPMVQRQDSGGLLRDKERPIVRPHRERAGQRPMAASRARSPEATDSGRPWELIRRARGRPSRKETSRRVAARRAHRRQSRLLRRPRKWSCQITSRCATWPTCSSAAPSTSSKC